MERHEILQTGFVKVIKKRIESDLDAIIIVEGSEGSGKSTAAIYYAMLIDKNFNLDNVIYSLDTATDLVYNSPPGSVIVWDEACYDMSRRDAMTKTNKNIIKLVMATRSRNLIHMICIPHMEDLESYISDRRACFTMSVYMSRNRRGFFILKAPKQYKDKHNKLKTKWITIFRMRFKKLPTKIDLEYKERKEKYSRAKMENISGVEKDGRYIEYKKMRDMGMKDVDIARKWNITPSAVCQWKKKWMVQK